ncbi:hypothetical protein KP509_02G019900 [Ceratopteris richardii]|nr:hypothetical protein KP509_02G019900 [Ceratopteris richardii]
MYAKCGAFEKAEELLHQLLNQDVVSWTALIAGYTQNGYDEDAMVCFKKMQSKGLFPDAFTYSCIFKACGNMLASDMGEKVHSQVRNNFLIEKNLVVANGLIDMYAKCGNLDKAKDVFDGVAKKDIGSWNALIAGYTRSGQQDMVLELFTQMQVEGFPHDAFTLICILKACTSIGSTDLAFMLHDDILKYGWDRDVEAGTALAMMYANCYMVQEARGMFNGLPIVDMISWSARMEGYGKLGSDELLLQLLSKVIETNVEPDLIMSTIVLNLCNHRGLLEVAQRYFKSMWPVYGMHPNIQHYTCLIDLLCRVGDVDRAVLILLDMPFLPTLTELNILMGACTTHGNTKLGKWAFEHAVELDENSVSAYVFMSNIHVSTIEV